jgi:hypothetical protein
VNTEKPIDTTSTMIDGNIKALIPLCREILTREDLDTNGNPITEV